MSDLPPPPPPPPPGYQPFGAGGPGGAPVARFGAPMAEWWKRLVAIIIDGLVVGIPSQIVVAAFDFGTFESRDGQLEWRWNAGGLLAMIAIPLAYYGLLNGGAKGQTLGKMAMRIAVRDADSGGPIGVGRAMGRYLVMAVLFYACVIPGIINALSPLWDRRRQSWHDKAVRSVVVDVP